MISLSCEHLQDPLSHNLNALIMNTNQTAPTKQGLYDPQMEHDACGVGFIVHQKGEKSHSIDNPMGDLKLNYR
jgi:hypothetical protein